MINNESSSIVILGASGNLALTKLLPSFYILFTSGALPHNFVISGYSRTSMSNNEYRKLVKDNLKNNIDETLWVEGFLQEFLNTIHYYSGEYNSVEDFIEFHKVLDSISKNFPSQPNVLYYLSIPPSVFEPVINSLRE